MKKFTLYNDNCLNALKTMDDNSIDSCVTDPPYGLSFMAKSWDYDVPKKEIWEEVFRVLKPGGHLLAFFGSRTYHRGVVQIEDAGFEIRDQIMWLYGSGFPKSHNIGKAIDKSLGAERKILETKTNKSGGFAHIMKTNNEQGYRPNDYYEDTGNIIEITEPATDEAKQWNGWGTALKPAHEPIVVARKPIEQNTIVENVLKHGTGALNIDDCRVTLSDNDHLQKPISGRSGESIDTGDTDTKWGFKAVDREAGLGRWPANVIHDGSDEVVSGFPNAASGKSNGNASVGVSGEITPMRRGNLISRNDSGSAARFFYCAKASKADRDEGLDIESKLPAAAEFRPNHMEKAMQGEDGNPYGRWSPRKNIHPTVKPTELMRYLCRLVTPKNGVVLDPFMGSGTTGKAAALEGFDFIGIEMTEDYFDIAKMRIEYAYNNIQEKSSLEEFFS
jgi:DNA modification methylase